MSTHSPMKQPDGKAATLRTTFSRTTSVALSINSDAAIIWALLTNVSDFARWNSTIVSIEGEITAGGKIRLTSTLDPSRVFKLSVRTLTPESLMVWASGAAPFFSGVRTYELKPSSGGSTTFSMTEKLAGMMFPLAAKHIPDFDAAFEQFAADLKREAELIHNTNQ